MKHMNSAMTALVSITVSGANDKVALEKVRSVLISLEDNIRRKKEEAITENEKF